MRGQLFKWAIAALAVVGALTFALWPRGDLAAPPTEDVTAVRQSANLPDCPREVQTVAPTKGPFGGLDLTCLSDGQPRNLSAMLAGKPALLNLWAYWCGPCREELPMLQQYAEQAGDRITVLTVHSDPQEGAALQMLADLGIRLPGVMDPKSRVAELVKAPKALPISVLIRADGSIATLITRPFTGIDDIERVVAEELGDN